MSSYQECDQVAKFALEAAKVVFERKKCKYADDSALKGAYSYYANCAYQSSSVVPRARAHGLESVIRADVAFSKEFETDALTAFNEGVVQPLLEEKQVEFFDVAASGTANISSSSTSDQQEKYPATPPTTKSMSLGSALKGGHGFIVDDFHLPDSRGTLSCAVYVWKDRRCARFFHRIMQSCINEAAQLMLPPPFHAAGIPCVQVSYANWECSVLLLPPVASTKPLSTATSTDALSRPLRESEEGCGHFALRTLAAALSPLLLPKSASLNAGEHGAAARVTVAAFPCAGNEALLLPRTLASLAQLVQDPSPAELPPDQQAKLVGKREKLLLVRPELQTEIEACGDDSQRVSQLIDRTLRAVAIDLVASFNSKVPTAAASASSSSSPSHVGGDAHSFSSGVQQHEFSVGLTSMLAQASQKDAAGNKSPSSPPTLTVTNPVEPSEQHGMYAAIANSALQHGEVGRKMHEHGVNIRLLYSLKRHLEALACERPMDAPIIQLVGTVVGGEMITRSVKHLVRAAVAAAQRPNTNTTTSNNSGDAAEADSPKTSASFSTSPSLSAERKKGIKSMLLNKTKRIVANEEANPLDDPNFDENAAAATTPSSTAPPATGAPARLFQLSDLQSIFDLLTDDRIYYREVILPTMRQKFRCPEGFFVDRESLSVCLGGIAAALARSFACDLDRDMKTFNKVAAHIRSVSVLPRLRQTFLAHLLHTCSHTYLMSPHQQQQQQNINNRNDGSSSSSGDQQQHHHPHLASQTDRSASHETFLRTGNVLPTTTLSQLTSGLSPRGGSAYNEAARILKFSFSEFMRHTSKSQQERENDTSVSPHVSHLESARSVALKQVAQRIRRSGIGRSSDSPLAMSPSFSSSRTNSPAPSGSARPGSAGDSRLKRFLAVWLLCCACGTMASDTRAAICRAVVSEFVVIFRLTSRSCFEASASLLAAIHTLKNLTSDFASSSSSSISSPSSAASPSRSAIPQRERMEIVGVAPDLLLFASTVGMQLVHEWHDPFFFCPKTPYIAESLPYELLLLAANPNSPSSATSRAAASKASNHLQQQQSFGGGEGEISNISHTFFHFMETCSRIFDTADARDGIGKDAAVQVIPGLSTFYNNILVWNLRAGTEIRPDGFADPRCRTPVGCRSPLFDESSCWAVGIDIVLLQPLFKLRLAQLVKRSTQVASTASLVHHQQHNAHGAAGTTPTKQLQMLDRSQQSSSANRYSHQQQTTPTAGADADTSAMSGFSQDVDDNNNNTDGSGVMADDEQSFVSAAAPPSSASPARGSAASWWMDVALFSLSTVYPQLANAALQTNTVFDPVVPPATPTSSTFSSSSSNINNSSAQSPSSAAGPAGHHSQHSPQQHRPSITAATTTLCDEFLMRCLLILVGFFSDSGSIHGDLIVLASQLDRQAAKVLPAMLSMNKDVASSDMAELIQRINSSLNDSGVDGDSSFSPKRQQQQQRPSSAAGCRKTRDSGDAENNACDQSEEADLPSQDQSARMFTRFQSATVFSPANDSKGTIITSGVTSEPQRVVLSEALRIAMTTAATLPNHNASRVTRFAAPPLPPHHPGRRTSSASSARGVSSPNNNNRRLSLLNSSSTTTAAASPAARRHPAELPSPTDPVYGTGGNNNNGTQDDTAVRTSIQKKLLYLLFKHVGTLLHSLPVSMSDLGESLLALWQYWVHHLRRGTRRDHLPPFDMADWRRYAKKKSLHARISIEDEVSNRMVLESEEAITFRSILNDEAAYRERLEERENAEMKRQEQEYAASRIQSAHRQRAAHEQFVQRSTSRERLGLNQNGDEERRYAALKIQSLSRQRVSRKTASSLRTMRFGETQPHVAERDELVDRQEIELEQHLDYMGLRRSYRRLEEGVLITTSDDETYANEQQQQQESRRQEAEQQQQQKQQAEEELRNAQESGIEQEQQYGQQESEMMGEGRAALRIQSLQRQRAARRRVDNIRATKRDFAIERQLLVSEEELARLDIDQEQSCEFAGIRRMLKLTMNSGEQQEQWKALVDNDDRYNSDVDEDKEGEGENEEQENGNGDDTARAALRIQSAQRRRAARHRVSKMKAIKRSYAEEGALICAEEALARVEVEQQHATDFGGIRRLHRLFVPQEQDAWEDLVAKDSSARTPATTEVANDNNNSNNDDDENNNQMNGNNDGDVMSESRAALRIQSLQRQRAARKRVQSVKTMHRDFASEREFLTLEEEVARRELDQEECGAAGGFRRLIRVLIQSTIESSSSSVNTRESTGSGSDDDADGAQRTEDQNQTETACAADQGTTTPHEQEAEQHDGVRDFENRLSARRDAEREARLAEESRRIEELRESVRSEGSAPSSQQPQTSSRPSSARTLIMPFALSAAGGRSTMNSTDPQVLELDELEVEMRFSIETCERRMRRMLRLPQ